MLDQKHCDGNKNAFSGLNSRLDMAEERTYEPEDVPIENSKCEKQRQRLGEKTLTQNRKSKNCRTLWNSYKGGKKG
jgi:hypothetical protein